MPDKGLPPPAELDIPRNGYEGCVVSYKDALWQVRGCGSSGDVLTLTQGVPGDDIQVYTKDCTFISRPPDWPFIVGKASHAKHGAVTRVFRSGVELEALHDWAPSSFGRAGGSIFFQPSLALKLGEVLTVMFEDGFTARYDVGPKFNSVKGRQSSPPKDLKAVPTFFERLLEDDDL